MQPRLLSLAGGDLCRICCRTIHPVAVLARVEAARCLAVGADHHSGNIFDHLAKVIEQCDATVGLS